MKYPRCAYDPETQPAVRSSQRYGACPVCGSGGLRVSQKGTLRPHCDYRNPPAKAEKKTVLEGQD